MAVVNSPTAGLTVGAMRKMFAVHGIPQKCVTENGPCFISQEFAHFMESNGVDLIHSTPYHPATNDLADKSVQTVKNGLSRQGREHSMEERFAAFLLTYRVTPQSTTGIAPY